ncbi:acyl-coenzyme A thioesterase 5-like [Diadema setosum]|uniref:acyl-coenzyme A thioesterase 5-like n=1 Tax=Diadema setosum TaxID=31175 RepID=UPI003B3A1CD5
MAAVNRVRNIKRLLNCATAYHGKAEDRMLSPNFPAHQKRSERSVAPVSSKFEQVALSHVMSSPGKIAADSPAVTLTVEPTTALIDEQIKIQVRGLNPGQLVSIQTQVFTESGTTKFVSSANYRANNNGSVSVQTDPSLGGSFTGVEPMGPFWSLAPAPEHAKKFSRLIKYDVGTPFVFTFDVVDHQGDGKNGVLASATIKRCFIADYVEALPIKSGHAEGVLFLPEKRESSDPLPVVVDIRGLGMQPPMDRAALLASHGFAVISYHYLAAMVRQGPDGLHPVTPSPGRNARRYVDLMLRHRCRHSGRDNSSAAV